MKKWMTSLAVLMMFLVGSVAVTCISAADSAGFKIGDRVPDFKLKDYNGKEHSLYDSKGSKATIVMFIATECPYSNAYNQRMGELAREYKSKGVEFVVINPNSTEPAERVAEHAKKNNFPFPVLKDVDNIIADQWKASVTPEVFVMDTDWTLKYHGWIDNEYRNPKQPAKDYTPDLRNALDALLAGKPIAKTETKAFGCTIKRVKKPQA